LSRILIKTLLSSDTDTLIGRLAFPLFFFAFAWTLPSVIERPGVLTRHWISPALFAQVPFLYLFTGHGWPWWTMANILLVFIGLTWVAWAVRCRYTISATLAVPALSVMAWGSSYGFIGPLSTLAAIGAHATQGVLRMALAGLSAVLFLWFTMITSGSGAMMMQAVGVPAALFLASRLPEIGRLLSPGFLAWAYAGHLAVLAAVKWSCESGLGG